MQLSMNAASTELTVVAPERKHAAVPAKTEDVRITVERIDKPTGQVLDTSRFEGTREIAPAVPEYTDPIKVKDDSGATWNVKTDDGVTAVYTRAS